MQSQTQTKLEQMMEVISTMSKGELFSAYNILKAYYEVSLEDSTPIFSTFTASPSFYLSIPDDSLLMDEQMICSAPVAAAPVTTSPSFYLSIPDESFLMDEKMITSAPVADAISTSPSFYLSIPDESLIMDEQMITSAPVAAAVTASSSFYLSIPDDSLLMDEKMISASVHAVNTTKADDPFAMVKAIKARVEAKRAERSTSTSTFKPTTASIIASAVKSTRPLQSAKSRALTPAQIRTKVLSGGYAKPVVAKKTTNVIAPVAEGPKKVNLKIRVSLAPRRVAAK